MASQSFHCSVPKYLTPSLTLSRKVRILLDELDLPYEWETVEFNEVKTQPYIQINPNGRLPSIEDPNTGVVLWEVCQ